MRFNIIHPSFIHSHHTNTPHTVYTIEFSDKKHFSFTTTENFEESFNELKVIAERNKSQQKRISTFLL